MGRRGKVCQPDCRHLQPCQTKTIGSGLRFHMCKICDDVSAEYGRASLHQCGQGTIIVGVMHPHSTRLKETPEMMKDQGLAHIFDLIYVVVVTGHGCPGPQTTNLRRQLEVPGNGLQSRSPSGDTNARRLALSFGIGDVHRAVFQRNWKISRLQVPHIGQPELDGRNNLRIQ